MEGRTSIKTYLIFRLAICLAAGIFFAETTRIEAGNWMVGGLLLVLVVLAFLLRTVPYSRRWMFGAVVSFLMFLTGWALTEHAWRRVEVAWDTERHTYIGVVQETPEEKPRTIQCRTQVNGKDVLLYVSKDSLSRQLRMGDELVFRTRIEQPKNDSLSVGFDYARYLYRQGVSGTAYVPASQWKKTDAQPALTWKQKALSWRESLLEKYRAWGIGDSQMPVLSALTLGYKGGLDKETREAYSVAGISHVLALSGMHIGIIWLLLDVLLRPLGIIRRLRWVKWLVVTALLWLFAFMVGLEASVVRAVVMCMLMELGRLAGTRPFSLNTLSVAAFFMLLYHPYYLFDVGFQLSFVAVASILIFYPLFFRLLPIKNRWGRSLWGVTSVSLAAQLGTAPLVMYYFSNASAYFLLTNIVAALIVPLIIYGAVLMIVLFPWTDLQGWVVGFLHFLVDSLNGLAEWTSSLPYARFALSHWEPFEIVLFYGALAFLVQYRNSRRHVWLIWGLVAFASLLAVHLYVVCRG